MVLISPDVLESFSGRPFDLRSLGKKAIRGSEVNSLCFGGDGFSRLRSDLLSQAPNEAAAVLLAGIAISDSQTRFLVRENFVVPPAGYVTQEELRLVVAPGFLAPLLKRARLEGWSLVLAHTHPFSVEAHFSDVDDAGEDILLPTIQARAPSRPHAALVIGKERNEARFRNEGGKAIEIPHLLEIGRNVQRHYKGFRNSISSVRYDRSIRLLGSQGQGILSDQCVAIVGLGGTGSLVAETLAHLGVGEFVLLDHDSVDKTSLNRLVGATELDVGTPKVLVAERHIRRINPEAKVDAIVGSVNEKRYGKELLKTDFVMCCTDSHGSRAVINQLAYQYMIPAIDMGIRIDASEGQIGDVAGRVQLLSPGMGCLVCQSLLNPEEVRRDLLAPEERARDPYIVGAIEPQPSVISLNATVASLATTMFMSTVLGLPFLSRHQIYLAGRGQVRSVETPPIADCIVCSMRGAFGRGDLWPLPWRTA